LTPTVLKGYHKMYLENSIYNMKKKVAGKNKSFFFKKKHIYWNIIHMPHNSPKVYTTIQWFLVYSKELCSYNQF
jgi:hypothetical protein